MFFAPIFFGFLVASIFVSSPGLVVDILQWGQLSTRLLTNGVETYKLLFLSTTPATADVLQVQSITLIGSCELPTSTILAGLLSPIAAVTYDTSLTVLTTPTVPSASAVVSAPVSPILLHQQQSGLVVAVMILTVCLGLFLWEASETIFNSGGEIAETALPIVSVALASSDPVKETGAGVTTSDTTTPSCLFEILGLPVPQEFSIYDMLLESITFCTTFQDIEINIPDLLIQHTTSSAYSSDFSLTYIPSESSISYPSSPITQFLIHPASSVDSFTSALSYTSSINSFASAASLLNTDSYSAADVSSLSLSPIPVIGIPSVSATAPSSPTATADDTGVPKKQRARKRKGSCQVVDLKAQDKECTAAPPIVTVEATQDSSTSLTTSPPSGTHKRSRRAGKTRHGRKFEAQRKNAAAGPSTAVVDASASKATPSSSSPTLVSNLTATYPFHPARPQDAPFGMIIIGRQNLLIEDKDRPIEYLPHCPYTRLSAKAKSKSKARSLSNATLNADDDLHCMKKGTSALGTGRHQLVDLADIATFRPPRKPRRRLV
ncbi:hypothetical protein PHLCEN_2v8078 [Hermanssonia centrifuga]|uniref:Uncharacterized protein n=1 Tax=Hermanssonia centrifuga TaxID=98765 RepID=A0A2R6NUQ1_9APHY|nr:hypothetical protein PHLCEN_2v8078 [Hermanssonia centrifuga]